MARNAKPWWREDRNSWYVTIRGVRHRLGSDKADAYRKFHRLMSEEPGVARPNLPTSTGLTVAEVVDKFLDWCQNHRAPRTYEWYFDHLQSFIDFLVAPDEMPVPSLAPYHVSEWADRHASWGDTFRRNAIGAVQRPFNWAAKLGYIGASPIPHIEKPRPERRDNPLSPEDFKALFAHVRDEAFRDLLEFAWQTGVRPQEARHIEPRHVFVAKRRIEIPPAEAKGKKRWRIIRLSDRATEIVERLMARRKQGKLFLNRDGNPWKNYAICNRFGRLSKKLGKRFAAYDLRHGFCQRMLESGADHLTVAELLGHANGQMVATTYQHLGKADKHLMETLKKASTAGA